MKSCKYCNGKIGVKRMSVHLAKCAAYTRYLIASQESEAFVDYLAALSNRIAGQSSTGQRLEIVR